MATSIKNAILLREQALAALDAAHKEFIAAVLAEVPLKVGDRLEDGESTYTVSTIDVNPESNIPGARIYFIDHGGDGEDLFLCHYIPGKSDDIDSILESMCMKRANDGA